LAILCNFCGTKRVDTSELIAFWIIVDDDCIEECMPGQTTANSQKFKEKKAP